MEITATITGSEEVVENFRRGSGEIIQRIIRGANRAMVEVQQHIVRDKLSGQVLNQRSGKLAGSIRVVLATFDGDTISAGVEGAGGPAWYGRLFELTGSAAHDIVPVRAKALAFYVGGVLVFARKVHIPAMAPRPFMAPAWDELRQNTQMRIVEAMNGVTG